LSRFLGRTLTSSLMSRLSSDPKSQKGMAILLATVDAKGWPHMAMLSAWEIFAPDRNNIRVATYTSSATTENLRRNGAATIVLFDEGATFYVKCIARLLKMSLKCNPANSMFNLGVDGVLEDYLPGTEVTGIIYLEREHIEPHQPIHDELEEEA